MLESVTALAKTVMTAVTFGLRVPAGIFLPSEIFGPPPGFDVS